MTTHPSPGRRPRGWHWPLVLPWLISAVMLVGAGFSVELLLKGADHGPLRWALAAVQAAAAGWLIVRLVRGPGSAPVQEHVHRLLMTIMVLVTIQLMIRRVLSVAQGTLSIVDGVILAASIGLLVLFLTEARHPRA